MFESGSGSNPMFMLDKYVDLKVDLEAAMMTTYYYMFYSEYFDGNFDGKSPDTVPYLQRDLPTNLNLLRNGMV
jgi:hypothetical protein